MTTEYFFWVKCHFQGFVTQGLIASGGHSVIGQSVIPAPNYR